MEASHVNTIRHNSPAHGACAVLYCAVVLDLLIVESASAAVIWCCQYRCWQYAMQLPAVPLLALVQRTASTPLVKVAKRKQSRLLERTPNNRSQRPTLCVTSLVVQCMGRVRGQQREYTSTKPVSFPFIHVNARLGTRIL